MVPGASASVGTPRVPPPCGWGLSQLTGHRSYRPGQELYLQIKTRTGRGTEYVKKRLQCVTKGSSGALRESTWVPKATLATTSVV